MTAKTELSKVSELDQDLFDDADEPNRFYDYIDNYHQLRHSRGDMPDDIHNVVLRYLTHVLEWLYRFEKYKVGWEFNFYETNEYKEQPLYPDIFVFKRPVILDRSYQLGPEGNGTAPEIIIEIMSNKTRLNDIGSRPEHKPQRYAKWGVREYFVYDPRPRQRKLKAPRLWGWRLVAAGQYEPIEAQVDGRMWSEQLDSWFVPDGQYVRLYDKDGNLRLTEAEAAQRRADILAQKLRELGVDPDSIA